MNALNENLATRQGSFSVTARATAPVLEMRNISKSFGAIQALKNVSFTVYPGELHALMGENGAGKSTLMKVLSGAYTADPGGEIIVGGEPMPTGNPKLAKARGIAVVILPVLTGLSGRIHAAIFSF